MAILNLNYEVDTDSRTGLAVLVATGRCTDDERAGIEAGATRRYQMVVAPNASGAVLKSLDGTNPTVLTISPPALPGASFKCVKVDARVSPFAYRQVGGTYNGKYIHRFRIVYQEVGGVV
jgi:hypothetical protein